MDIPTEWTFKTPEVAAGFDAHVREQLPWYDLATRAVVHFGRHYIPRGGTVYDIGASTGNIGNALRDTLASRDATLIAIEESESMRDRYVGPGTFVVADAAEHAYKPYDFAVCFLVLMFLPVGSRRKLIERLTGLINPGGALLIVDKLNTEPGYFGTVSRRLAMRCKLDNGATPEQIIEKELSLAGYQRPMDVGVLGSRARQFFQFGEFAGWVIESEQRE